MNSRNNEDFVRRYLTTTSVVIILICIGLFTMPGMVIDVFTMAAVEHEAAFVRFLGASLLGFATLNALAARRGTDLEVVVMANLTALLLAIGLDVYGQLSHQLSMAAWLLALIHTWFAGGFLYCLRRLKR